MFIRFYVNSEVHSLICLFWLLLNSIRIFYSSLFLYFLSYFIIYYQTNKSFFFVVISDNHDVISLDTYVDKSVLEQAEYEKSRRVLFEIAPVNMTEENRVLRYVCVCVFNKISITSVFCYFLLFFRLLNFISVLTLICNLLSLF